MISLTKFAEDYPLIRISPSEITTITEIERRPHWTEGFWRKMARLKLRSGEEVIVVETAEEVEIRIAQAAKEGLSDLQRAVLLLCDSLNISIVSQSSHDAELSFHGRMGIEYDEIGQLIESKIITLGYKTGRIKKCT